MYDTQSNSTIRVGGGFAHFFFELKELKTGLSNGVEKIKDIAKQVVDSFGLTLDDVEYITQGKRWVLRIFIDKEGGIAVSDCEKVSVQLSYLLDAENVIPHAYLLEVSSPGLDKKLKRFDDYLKYKGRLVRLNTIKPYNDRTAFSGRIVSAEAENIRIETEKNGIVDILFSDVANARLEVEF